MSIPERLISFAVYGDDDSRLGLADVELPKIEMMSDDVKGAGVAGTVSTPTIGQFNSMELVFNWRDISTEALKMVDGGSVGLFDIRGAQQALDPTTGTQKVHALNIIVKGVPKSFELGKLDIGASTGSKTTLEVTYIKILIDKKLYLEIDKFNYKAVINGRDIMREIREALGL